MKCIQMLLLDQGNGGRRRGSCFSHVQLLVAPTGEVLVERFSQSEIGADLKRMGTPETNTK